MLRTEEKEIDGIRFMVTEFPAREGFLIKAKIIKMLAPALKGDANSIADMDIGSAVEKILEKITEDDFLAFVLRLLRASRADGKEITPEMFDIVFAGEKLLTVYKVLAFVLEVNFKSFFALLQTRAGTLKDIKNPLKSLREHIGLKE